MEELEREEDLLPEVEVRSYREGDHPRVLQLYSDGLLRGQIAPNDTGADVENVEEAYFDNDASHFWVAESNGSLVGMIGVARDEGHVAEIRRLRVDRDWQEKPVGAKLIATALTHCQKHGYLKVRLDTRFEPGAATELFERFGFHHTRTKPVQGKDLLEFYLDLYRQPKKSGEER